MNCVKSYYCCSTYYASNQWTVEASTKMNNNMGYISILSTHANLLKHITLEYSTHACTAQHQKLIPNSLQKWNLDASMGKCCAIELNEKSIHSNDKLILIFHDIS